jgi:hypothetical protein
MDEILSAEVAAKFFAPLKMDPKSKKKPAYIRIQSTKTVVAQATSEGIDLEYLSDLNLVKFFGKELREGLLNGRCKAIRHQLHALRDHDIVVRVEKGYELTKNGRKLLDEAEMLTNNKNTGIEPLEAPQDPPRGAKIGVKEVKTNE